MRGFFLEGGGGGGWGFTGFLRGRRGEQGRAGISPRSEAFRWTEANLLPVTKLVTSGFLAKCLGQVDLLSAPLKHHSWDLCPPCPVPPGFDESSMFLS